MSDRGRALEILMVEDNPADVRLVREILKELGAPHTLESVGTGEAALQRLRGDPETRVRRPDLILLDLNLPGMHGRDVLESVKGDERLRSVPIVVLTSSSAPADVAGCYERWANCYVVKRLSYVAMRDALAGLEQFWGDVAELPSAES